jgi:hypothetical protein
MICDETLALSDEHVRGCAACRAEQDQFDRDGRDLAEALLRAAAPRRRYGGWVPLSAAAAILASVLALVLMPVPAVDAPRPADARQFLVSREDALWGQVLAIDDAGRIAVSVGQRDGVQPRQALTLYRRTSDGEVEVGTLVVEDVQQAVSAGRLSEKLLEPAAGDFALADRLLDAQEKAAVLDHLFSFRPIEERRVIDALRRLESLDLEVRASGRRDLLAAGGAARVILERLDVPPALGIRAREALRESDRIDRLVRDAGLERDVEFLSRLRDPRAHARLRAILEGVMTVPPPGPEFADRLHEPWMSIKPRVRWNADRDRYE